MESEDKVFMALVISFALAVTVVISVNVITTNTCVMSLSKDSTRSIEDIKQICR
jgi:predicted nucleic acid-binding protein